LRIDGLGAYYPRVAYYRRDGKPVYFASRVPGVGDIPACGSCGLGWLGDQQQQQGPTAAQYGAAAGNLAVNIYGIASSNLPVSTKVETSVGGALMTAAMIPGPQAPFLAVAGAVAELLGAMGVGSGCGQSCVLSTSYANKAEQILSQNLNTYFALPAPRDPAARAMALNVFDAVWNDLSQQCSNPALGTAGRKCITDRQAGACTWRQTSDSGIPGAPAVGECWNWFNGYRDPIANDPNVAAVSATNALESAASSVSSVLAGTTAGVSNYLLLAGLAVGAAFLMGNN